ncbi:MAG: AsmA-like C-terminal domain-containing protein [Deltaproteobacteria bacterium]|nr:AsmA-like C-terminal domain-containing protein [Deltaproteobacteria bacterium]
MKNRFLILFLGASAALLLIGGATSYFRFYVAPWWAERVLQSLIQSCPGQEAAVEATTIHWLGRPAVEYRGLTIRKAGETEGWLRVEGIVLRPRLGSLLSRSIRWKALILKHPLLRIRGKEMPIPRGSLRPVLSMFEEVVVRDGRIEWSGRRIRGLSGSLRYRSEGRPLSIALEATLAVGHASAGRVFVRGRVWPLSAGTAPQEPRLWIEARAEGLDLDWFGAGLVRSLPPPILESRLALRVEFRGNPKGRFDAVGSVSLKGLSRANLADKVSARFRLVGDGREIEFQRIRLMPPLPPVEGTGRIQRRAGGDFWLTFHGSSPWQPVAGWRTILPFLPEKIRALVLSLRQGEARLVSLAFSGPLRGLASPLEESSLSYWSGEGRFRKVEIPWRGELFRLDSASVRLDRGRLVGAVGDCLFGRSCLEFPRFSLSGLLSDPLLFLVIRGKLNLGDVEKWLSRGLVPDALALPLSNLGLLSGTGDVDLKIEKPLGEKKTPLVTGRLALGGVTVTIRDFPGIFADLKGVLDLSPSGLTLRNVEGRWEGSTVKVLGSVTALSTGKPQVDLLLKGRLDLRDLARLATWEGLPFGARLVLQQTASPSGEGDYRLQVKGPLDPPGSAAVQGQLLVKEGATRLWNSYPVAGISGEISFSRHGVLIPELRGRWKNSDLALEVTLGRLGSTSVRNLCFSAEFDLRDIARERFDYGLPRRWRRFFDPFEFHSGTAAVTVTERRRNSEHTVEGRIAFQGAEARYPPVFPPLRNLEGEVLFGRKGLKAVDLRATLEGEPVAIEARFALRPGDPGPEISIHAARVDFEKVISWPWSRGILPGWSRGSIRTVRVRVDEGRFREIRLSDVEAELGLQGKRLSLDRLSFASSRGYGLVTGWVDFEENGELSFEFRPYLVNLDTGLILASFQRPAAKRQLTGLGSASGIIRGRGEGVLQLARSLNGEVRIFLADGRLARFDVLSKIFSLLDLSQVLRGNLPDLKSEGMHYRAVTGHVTFKDGGAWTSDLVLDSESMIISAVGGVDLLSGELEVKLGLRRLGFGGKMVSKVPFFGKIITSNGGSFLQYYLQVRGTVGDPEVKGIPLESVGKGILDPLEKLFEKPLDWFPFQRHPSFDHYYEDRQYRYP